MPPQPSLGVPALLLRAGLYEEVDVVDIFIAGMPASGYGEVAAVLASLGVRAVPAPGVAVSRCSRATASRALDDWLTGSAPGGAVVLVYRNPWDSVLSSLCSGERRLVGDPGVIRDAWQAFHEEVLARLDASDQELLLVSYDAVVEDPAALVKLAAQLNGQQLTASAIPSGSLGPSAGAVAGPTARRGRGDPISHLYRLVYPALTGLLDELDARAAVPWGSGTDTPARVAHVLPGGSLPAGSGLQVIVPCHNDGRFIVEAVASVARAASDPVELTIVDDGSDEPETLRVMGCLRDAGFQVLASRGVGVCEARNQAITVSSTAAVLPLDSDNLVRSELLDALPLILGDEADVVYGAQAGFGIQNRVYRPAAMTWAAMPHNPVDQCALIRRSLLEAIGGWDPAITLWEDWDLWMSALEHGARFHVLPEVTFDYLVRSESTTRTVGSDSQARAETWRAIYRKHRESLAEVIIEGLIALDEQRRAEAAARQRLQAHFELLQRQVLLRERRGEDLA